MYFVKNGACVDVLIRNERAADVAQCDLKNGEIAYFSKDPGVQPDDTNLPNKIIVNGRIPGGNNYLEKCLNHLDTECDDPSHNIITLPNTKTIRAIGVCVNETVKKLF